MANPPPDIQIGVQRQVGLLGSLFEPVAIGVLFRRGVLLLIELAHQTDDVTEGGHLFTRRSWTEFGKVRGTTVYRRGLRGAW